MKYAAMLLRLYYGMILIVKHDYDILKVHNSGEEQIS